MANKRMFSMDIIDSDAFLDMPLSTHALYFHLSMRADDEDFYKAEEVNSNSQLYKQAGNSIVVDVLYYLFKQML